MQSERDGAAKPMPPRKPDFPVVGIGASAGGMTALKKFLEHLPAETGMAFVVIFHLSPRHQSSADRILQRHTRMPTTQVAERTRIEPNHVYVNPPRQNLVMADGHLSLCSRESELRIPVAIDLFFRALADEHREMAFAIIMSGTGTDGTLGLRRIKERGGVTMVQSPEDCDYDDMPKNAIAAGDVDFVAPAADMPQMLRDVRRNARDIALPSIGGDGDGREPSSRHEEALAEILAILEQRTGHDFRQYKRATVLRRLERRLQVCMVADICRYRDHLRDHPAETAHLLDDMLISVTQFFRDREAFDALEREVIPALFDHDAEASDSPGALRVWVPGCATGEEAYSIAMLLHEESGRRGMLPQCQVFASDIDAEAIAWARRGSYPRAIVTDIAPTRLNEFFRLEQDRYKIRKTLRESVLFAVHNVLRDPPFSRLDLISCRNLMIYLNRELQERLLEMFHAALRPGGVLFLGLSETADAPSEMFETVDKKHRIYRARGVAARQKSIAASPLRSFDPAGAVRERAPAPRTDMPRMSFANLHQQALEHYAPPSLVVDRNANIVHMSERVGQYLQHVSGEPSRDLLALVHPALRLELRSALFQAIRNDQNIQTRPIVLPDGTARSGVQMFVRPFTDTASGAQFLLVLFASADDAPMSSAQAPVVLTGDSDGGVVSQLEKALHQAHQQLQTSQEQYNTSVEDLNASNEELQVINEELRSTTEELETSSEELQSANEELITVNAELKAKVDETEQVNDDLLNFLASSNIATIFVDREFRLRRYTAPAESIFKVIPGDLGRSLFDISNQLTYPDLQDDMAHVMNSLQSSEREIRSRDGRRFICRILPYQTGSRRIDGAVLTLVDISSLRNAEEQLALGREEMRLAVLESNDFAVVAIDSDGVIIGWNNGARVVFGYEEPEILGLPVATLFTPEDIAAGIPEQEMSRARSTGRAIDERWHLRKGGARIFCSGVMTSFSINGRCGFVKIARDATGQRHDSKVTEIQLRRARAAHRNAKAAIALKEDFLAMISHELKHPLNLISVNAELIARVLADGLADSPIARQALDTISRSVRAQSRIVDDLLDLSRIRTGKLSLDLAPVDVTANATAAVGALQPEAAAAGVSLLIDSVPGPVFVIADAARLSQILWNLLSNAIKFTPNGGRVTVRVGTEGAFARLDVTDTGCGIEARSLPRIFDMFGQARPRNASRRSGLGIGLSVVRQLVEHHDGRVAASSEGPGKGSRFTVWLPLPLPMEHTNASNAALAPTGSQAGLHGMELLVVDDDAGAVEAVATLLSLEGAEVQEATSGQQAIELARSRRFDLILSDIGMPDMDGFELLERLKAALGEATPPVIAVTGFGRENDAAKSLSAGFSAHVPKPVDVESLLQTILDIVADASLAPRGSTPD